MNPSPATRDRTERALSAARLTMAPTDGDNLALQLGTRGAVVTEGGRTYPLALTVPIDSDRLTDAISRASCQPLFKRLRNGWTESAGNRLTHLLGVEATDDRAYAQLIRSLAAVSSADDATSIAYINFGQNASLSPSPGVALAAGERAELTMLSHSELHGLAVVLDLMSDAPTGFATQAIDIRTIDQNTSAARDAFNRATSAAEVDQTLSELGWVQETTVGDVTTFTRNSESAEFHRDPRVFLTLGADDTPNEIYRPFDLLLLSRPPGAGTTPESLATWLIEQGHVAVDTPVLVAHGKRRRIQERQDTPQLARAFVDAIKNARLATDEKMPLAFARQANGVPAGVVSLLPSGRLKWWGNGDTEAASLLLAAAQLVEQRTTKSGDTYDVPRHVIPRSVGQLALSALESPGALPPLEHVATEPLLTEMGVAAAPGYNRAHKAAIMIPHRDRARWTRDYAVPEKPSLPEAQAAYEYLDTELLDSFPFASPTDRARAMAYLLTCVGRNLADGSIGFNATAPDRGSGKSLLLMIGRILGRGAPNFTAFKVGGWNDGETEKRLATLVLNGGRFFHADEVPRNQEVKGETLSSAITARDGEYTIRALGGHGEILATGLVITLAGNGTSLGGDHNRRFLTIRLQRPVGTTALDNTTYRHPDLVRWTIANRPSLLAAAHTVLLYSLQHKDEQRQMPGMKLSSNWPDIILGALSHVTAEDGTDVATLALQGWNAEVAEQDDIGEQWGELLSFIFAQVGVKPQTSSDLLSLTKSTKAGEAPALPDSLASAFGTPAKIAQHWGYELKKTVNVQVPHDGRVYQLIAANGSEKSKKSRRYSVHCYTQAGAPVTPGALPTEAELAANLAATERREAY